MRLVSLLVLGIALSNCGAGKDSSQEPVDRDNRTVSRISLSSSAFKDGQPIPTDYSCDGANRAPELRWGNPPEGTKSFALVINDPDAPGGTFQHWGVFDIPATARSIVGGQKAGKEATNDNGSVGYTGPCPPPGHGLHHYHFKLFALSVDRLALSDNAKVIDVENAASSHTIARGELIGTYERK
jgi:hypothetical protein